MNHIFYSHFSQTFPPKNPFTGKHILPTSLSFTAATKMPYLFRKSLIQLALLTCHFLHWKSRNFIHCHCEFSLIYYNLHPNKIQIFRQYFGCEYSIALKLMSCLDSFPFRFHLLFHQTFHWEVKEIKNFNFRISPHYYRRYLKVSFRYLFYKCFERKNCLAVLEFIKV